MDNAPAHKAPELHKDMTCYDWSENTFIFIYSIRQAPLSRLFDLYFFIQLSNRGLRALLSDLTVATLWCWKLNPDLLNSSPTL